MSSHHSHSMMSRRRHRSNRAKGNGFVGCTILIMWIILYLTGALKSLVFKNGLLFETRELVFAGIFLIVPIIIGAVVYNSVKKALIERYGEEDGSKRLQNLDKIFTGMALVLFAVILFIAMKTVRDGF